MNELLHRLLSSFDNILREKKAHITLIIEINPAASKAFRMIIRLGLLGCEMYYIEDMIKLLWNILKGRQQPSIP